MVKAPPMNDTLERMSTRRKPASEPDKHKNKPLQLRLVDEMRQALDMIAKANGTNASTEARIAIRKYLAAEGYWPLPKKLRD